ncbi:hypothetical protein DPMN_135456 [Dreissena polymorpha]|uniref:Uncharacterized protein n=1 Tax=Dreissena polymorpha TaxID=45954 RepID=A0A9D4JFT5_DREPO|nr:hypothetical protein DPMN_135456 [Dreissena polymorpha]
MCKTIYPLFFEGGHKKQKTKDTEMCVGRVNKKTENQSCGDIQAQLRLPEHFGCIGT